MKRSERYMSLGSTFGIMVLTRFVFLGIGYAIDLPDEALYRYLVTSNNRMPPACNESEMKSTL